MWVCGCGCGCEHAAIGAGEGGGKEKPMSARAESIHGVLTMAPRTIPVSLATGMTSENISFPPTPHTPHTHTLHVYTHTIDTYMHHRDVKRGAPSLHKTPITTSRGHHETAAPTLRCTTPDIVAR